MPGQGVELRVQVDGGDVFHDGALRQVCGIGHLRSDAEGGRRKSGQSERNRGRQGAGIARGEAGDVR